jgi:DNA-binding MarR family transcriptional regulator
MPASSTDPVLTAGEAFAPDEPAGHDPYEPAGHDPYEPAGHDPYGLAVADVVSRLRRAMRRAARAHGSGGLPGGLSVAQLEFLSCLAENPGARPGQLARMLRLAPSSVATLVNVLAREQLIERSGGVADRRTAVLSLTTGGTSVVTSWQQVNARIITDALARLDEASRATLALALPALSKLTGAVDALADETRAVDALADETRADETRAVNGPLASRN